MQRLQIVITQQKSPHAFPFPYKKTFLLWPYQLPVVFCNVHMISKVMYNLCRMIRKEWETSWFLLREKGHSKYKAALFYLYLIKDQSRLNSLHHFWKTDDCNTRIMILKLQLANITRFVDKEHILCFLAYTKDSVNIYGSFSPLTGF